MSLDRLHQAQQVQQQPLQKQQAPQEPPMEGHYAGYAYRAERGGEPGGRDGQRTQRGQGRPPPPRQALQPRRARRLPNAGQQLEIEEQGAEHDSMDDTDKPFDPFRHMQMGAGGDAGADGDQGRSGHGSRDGSLGGKSEPMQCRLAPPTLARERPSQRLLQLGLPGAEMLFAQRAGGAAGAMDFATAAAMVVLSAVSRRAAAGGAGMPGMALTLMMAGHAQLERQPEHLPVVDLAGTKTLLLAASRDTWGGKPLPPDQPDSVRDTLALLPVKLLNAFRPRTPAQRLIALDRSEFIMKSKGVQ